MSKHAFAYQLTSRWISAKAALRLDFVFPFFYTTVMQAGEFYRNVNSSTNHQILYKNSVNNHINGYLSFCPTKPEDIKVWYGVFLVLVILVKYYYNIPVSLQFSATARVYLVEQKLNIMTGNCRDFPGFSVSNNCKKLIARLGLQRFQIETIQFLPSCTPT